MTEQELLNLGVCKTCKKQTPLIIDKYFDKIPKICRECRDRRIIKSNLRMSKMLTYRIDQDWAQLAKESEERIRAKWCKEFR